MKKKATVLCLLFALTASLSSGCAGSVATTGNSSDTTSAETSDTSVTTTTNTDNVTSKTETADGVIKLGAVLPLSGASAESGIACQQGLELAVAEINENGGIEMNGNTYQLQLYC